MNKTGQARGQSMVIMAVALVVLLGLAALIIDGGSIYLNRRRAQTAADAAALAGANVMCIEDGTLADIQAAATQYAVVENGATAVESVIVDEDGQVVVQTRVASPSFLGAVFGQQEDAARAEAAAGCFIPASTTNMLPIAWTCRPPVGGSTEECKIHSIPWKVFKVLLGTFDFDAGLLDEGDGEDPDSYHDGVGGKMPYLVMDDSQFDYMSYCLELNPGGSMICDFDGDGILDVEGGANRGWLLLPGMTGANDLINVMLGGFPGELVVPHWLPGKNGVSNSVFINAHEIRFDLSLVPVFNSVCEDSTEDTLPTDCPSEYQSGDLISSPSGLHTYYRVVGTVGFVVSCVSKGTPEPCPAKTYSGVDQNTSTIEGYFIDGYAAGTEIDPDGFNLGVYVVSLTR